MHILAKACAVGVLLSTPALAAITAIALQIITVAFSAISRAPRQHERIIVELAGDVALDVAGGGPVTYNPAKWGEILQFLRSSGEISVEEEQGLAGVFRLLSPGAHRPVGIPEGQMTRLGRSFALNMCWFLLQNRLARRGI